MGASFCLSARPAVLSDTGCVYTYVWVCVWVRAGARARVFFNRVLGWDGTESDPFGVGGNMDKL